MECVEVGFLGFLEGLWMNRGSGNPLGSKIVIKGTCGV